MRHTKSETFGCTLHSSSRLKQLLYCLSAGTYLNVLEHIRVVADLLQLHDGVHQSLCPSFTLWRMNVK